MKFLLALCVLAVVALAASNPRLKRCIYVNGKCFKECDPGTHSYTPGCGPVKPEPTCDNPNPTESRGDICDFSSCYCNPPNVREPESRRCIPLEECPKKEDKKEDKKE